MAWIRHHDRVAFAAHVTPMLMRAEAENNLQLGMMNRFASNRSASNVVDDATPPLLLSYEEGGDVKAVAVRTPPNSLVLTRIDDEASHSLATKLKEIGDEVPGVVGPSACSRKVAELVCGGRHMTSGLHHRVRAYELPHEPTAPPAAAGAMRDADEGDIEILTEWIAAFALFIHEPHPDPRGGAKKIIDDRRMFLWIDGGRPVSMTAMGAETPNGVRINSVYTPEDLRGRGYAANLVAAVSRRALQNGRRFCFLFADIDNPTSTGIYLRMGYRPVCDYEHYKFTEIA